MAIHPVIQSLLGEIDAFIASTGVTPTEFGLEAIGDPNLCRDLKKGRCPRLPTIDRVRDFMAARAEKSAA